MRWGLGDLLVFALWGRRRQGRRRTEVEEELDDNIDTEHSVSAHVVEVETPDDEEDGKHAETHELNRLSADGINSGDGDPITTLRLLMLQPERKE